MKKIFEETEVPEGEHCLVGGVPFCKFLKYYQGQDVCFRTGMFLEIDGTGFIAKSDECLAAKSALECGHHPDALMNGDFNDGEKWCAACEQGTKKSALECGHHSDALIHHEPSLKTFCMACEQKKDEEPLLVCDVCLASEADLINGKARVFRWDEDGHCHLCEECE